MLQKTLFSIFLVLALHVTQAQEYDIPLQDIVKRDVCILADSATQKYYMIGTSSRKITAYISEDLANWKGPVTIWDTPKGFWGEEQIVNIWAPEMHAYRGKYYLFLTFNTNHYFEEDWSVWPKYSEQDPEWPNRVRRGCQILWSESPLGPYQAFSNRSALPKDMMTLDGTLWIEDGDPYMIFCHEWVQINDGSMRYVRLNKDLSSTIDNIDSTKLMFRASEAPWASEGRGNVTDGPYLYKSKSGKLLMIWSSFNNGSYTVGQAISPSGKLDGHWKQDPEPLYTKNSGHGMLFTTFGGHLMMVLHSDNNSRNERPLIFFMEDNGDKLIRKERFFGKKDVN